MQGLKNVVVVGGSYVGSGTATKLASALPPGYRPRFAIVPKHEHKAFIPYTHLFAPIPSPHSHAVIQAKAIDVDSHRVYLDRPAWHGREEVEYEFLVVASGTRLPSPGSMQDDHKLGGVGFFKTYQQGVQNAQEIVIVGGGAVGVQMMLDMKEVYPGKQVTLVHSRERVMNRFHQALDGIVRKRCEELGVQLVTGQRVVVPEQGFATDGTRTEVQLADGRKIPADLVILATGQIPNTQLLQTLNGTTTDPSTSIINPSNGFLRVRPTLQLLNPQYSHIFALGDVADTGAPKAARPGMMQADVVVQNVLSLIEGKEAEKEMEVGPAAIHLTLGLTQNVIFRNPIEPGGEPMIKMRDDGQEDMGIEGVWTRRGFQIKDMAEYHL
ncbi:hypothetical protein QFC20_005968 [Naganishia adeliensis]|uniref:Uncharacterized protein n=1 Tax=Naganishia adeliensis TaxID=92952 RepID=A0ACC2VHA5_9TREE|nr:hypothetical protein QFC20_005968 [Naganishia adeliensis]